MSIEAAGDAITGGLIARAIEPQASEDAPGADGFTHEHACLNCKTELIGGYCHNCGQHAHVHRTLGALGHDLLHGVFHFEGKVWRTIPKLFWNPGDLTRRYIHGERASFVSPLALFLFSVFLMFAVFETVGAPVGANGNFDDASFAQAETATRAKIAELEKERAEAIAKSGPTASIDSRLAKARADVDGLSAARALGSGSGIEALPSSVKVDTGDKALDERIKGAAKNPKLLAYKVQSSAYKFSWALIPLSLPFVWAMFAWKREYKAYDHAVFVTYSLCFVMLLLITMALLMAVGVSADWAVFAMPVHMFVQLRGAYRLSAASALWRTIVLMFVSLFVLIAFVLALLALGVLG